MTGMIVPLHELNVRRASIVAGVIGDGELASETGWRAG